MKKSIIAAGAASVALAAMPIVGAFAATVNYSSITDKVLLTVNESCKMEESDTVVETVAETTTGAGDQKYGTIVTLSDGSTGGIAPGTASQEGTGTAMTITCNSNDGWVLNAQATAMNSATGGYSIPFGPYITAADAAASSGSLTETTDSVWSARVAIDNAHSSQALYDNGSDAYSTISGVGAGNTIVVKNATTGTSPDPVVPIAADGVVVTPHYIAFADSEQEQGAYTGYITYTFVASNV